MLGSLLRHLGSYLAVYAFSADAKAQLAAGAASLVALGYSYLEKRVKKHL